MVIVLVFNYLFGVLESSIHVLFYAVSLIFMFICPFLFLMMDKKLAIFDSNSGALFGHDNRLNICSHNSILIYKF